MNLLEASLKGLIDRVKYLVYHGANIHYKNLYEDTSLILASLYGHLEVVKYLVSNGANIHDKDKYENTPLILASRHGHLEIVKYLIEHDADINDKNVYGYTLLINAFNYKHLNIVKYLCRQYLMKNIEPIEREKQIIDSFINKNKLWIYHYNSRILCKHDKIILDRIDYKIDIHEDLIKYILNF